MDITALHMGVRSLLADEFVSGLVPRLQSVAGAGFLSTGLLLRRMPAGTPVKLRRLI